MDNNTKAKDEPVTETQDAPVPSAEEKTEAPQGGEVDKTTQPVEALPDDSSDRTKQQFDKLRSELRAEREQRERVEKSFNLLQPKAEPTQDSPIYDPDTGLLNEDALTSTQKTAQEASARAAAAEEKLNQFVQNQEEREAFAAHPELNINDDKTFNKDFHTEVRKTLLDSMVNPNDYGGKQLNMKDAGDLVRKGFKTDTEAAKKEGAKQAIEDLGPKEQASLQAEGSSDGRQVAAQEDLEALKRKTRKGDIDATIARLKNIK